MLSRQEGGGRPVAGGLSRLLPIPHERQLGEREPHRSLQLSPAPRRLGSVRPRTHVHPHPNCKLASGQRADWGEFDPWAPRPSPEPWDSFRGSDLARCTFPNQLFSRGWEGGWSEESGYREGRVAEEWSQDVQQMEAGKGDEEAERRQRNDSVRGCKGAGVGVLMDPERRGPQGYTPCSGPWVEKRRDNGGEDVLKCSQMWPM